MNTLKKKARLAGFFYLVYFVLFFLADNGVHSTSVGVGDAAEVARQIITSEWLFRIGFVSFLFAAVFFLLSAWALYRFGFMIANIFFGVWLFPLGYLMFKSGFLPRILGILLLVDGVAILTWFFQFFSFPAYEVISYPCLAESFIAEASLCLWLLVKGVKEHVIPS